MSRSFDEQRKVLENAAIQAGIAVNVPLRVEGYAFSQPEDVTWADFSYENAAESFPDGQGGSAPGAKALDCTPGFVQIDVLVPEQIKGTGEGTRVAEDLGRRFSRAKWLVADAGHIMFGPSSVRKLNKTGAPRGFNRYCARVTFQFYHWEQAAA